MRKGSNSRGGRSAFRTLQQRLGDCSRFESEEDAVRYLRKTYPEYRRKKDVILTKIVREARFPRNDSSGGRDVQVQQSTSTSALSSEDSSPKFDLMRTMLREAYCQDGFEPDKTEESTEAKNEKNIELLEKDEMENIVMLEKTGGIGRKNMELDDGRDQVHTHPMFKDLGGMREVLEDLISDVLIPLRYPEVLNRLCQLRAGPPTGILLHGPPGCGKTMLAQAIANEAGLPLYQIASTEIVSGVSGESEGNIRELFLKARRTAPSIIFIDEIDAIAEKREGSQKRQEGRIVTQLLKCMDTICENASVAGQKKSVSESKVHSSPAVPEISVSENKQGRVLVIGATNRPNAIDPALRRPGRFNWEIELGVPDENARFEILSVLTRDLGVQEGLNLRKLARDTAGFVGADLEDYVRKASVHAMRKMINFKKDEGKECAVGPQDDGWWKQLRFMPGEMETLCPKMSDFEVARKNVQPSLKREGFSPVPNVKWEDVGGLGTIRQEFQSCIVDPIRNPEDYEGFGEALTAGFLLYGPPGCGKTLIAKAVANEAGASFIYIKGPELMDKYVGESESAIRKIFDRARKCSPCILFFDEVDALIANCGESSGVTDRIRKQLLIELDGAEERRGVYVIGATNRPELIDPALLRSGRIENLVYIPLPSPQERGLILKALAREKPIDTDVDLLAIAERTACDHFSGADLDRLMRHANRFANEERLLLKQRGAGDIPWIINNSHFEKALVGLAPSLNKKQRDFYDNLARNFRQPNQCRDKSTEHVERCNVVNLTM
ncbi:cell division control protein 48 homolog C-like [Chenopodium quinoa]|uniref:cell division control protein 48 homolog C-like n=1 Tax=Chenopodium quinoa TaxID=63459 RepID=UPI000B77FA69|nr:cell division control protein 48 homolog C-like [Chenopodium quinoa]